MFKSCFRSIAIVVAFVIGYCLPGLHCLSDYLSWILMLMLLFTCLSVRFTRIRIYRQHWALLIANIAIAFLMWGACILLFGGGDMAQAAFFTGIMPTATAAPVIMGLLHGKVEFVIVAFLMLTFGICLLLPFVLPIVIGQNEAADCLHIALNLLLVVVVPLIVAWFAQRFYPKVMRWSVKHKNINFMLWVTVLIIIAANASYSIQTEHSFSPFILVDMSILTLLICAFNFVVGYVLGGKVYSRECSQALGQKNTTLAIYLALLYTNSIVALGPTFYVLWHNLWNAWQITKHGSNYSK